MGQNQLGTTGPDLGENDCDGQNKRNMATTNTEDGEIKKSLVVLKGITDNSRAVINDIRLEAAEEREYLCSCVDEAKSFLGHRECERKAFFLAINIRWLETIVSGIPTRTRCHLAVSISSSD